MRNEVMRQKETEREAIFKPGIANSGVKIDYLLNMV